jgi:hypothetical protein
MVMKDVTTRKNKRLVFTPSIFLLNQKKETLTKTVQKISSKKAQHTCETPVCVMQCL